MTDVTLIKTNFTAGEISPRLLGRADLRAYDNGARTLRNVFIHPTGGVTRRAGLSFVDTAKGDGRLVAFEFNADQTYLLVFSEGRLRIYHGDERVADLVAPWTAAQIAQITWTQSADTLLITHPDVPPRKLTRQGETAWSLDIWTYIDDGGPLRQPFHRFAPANVTVTPSAVAGVITLTASQGVFDPRLEGTRMRVQKKQIAVISVPSATQLTATVIETLPGTAATADWDEQAFSPLRGWPITTVFHQNRLVIGGSRDLPNRLWMSRSADLWNFNLGTGLDDESIEFAILSDQVNAIRAVVSGRDLQVFTSGAEYLVTGKPLTPTNVQVYRQTAIGSRVDRQVPPRDVDGATLFVSRNGHELREFVYTETEDAYQATDLALLAAHLVTQPVDQDYDPGRRLMFVAMSDGSLAALTIYRVEDVTAWTKLTTDGAIRSVAVAGPDVYVLIRRDTVWTVERFDDESFFDAALTGEHETATLVWSGLEHLEGRTVGVLADGVVRENLVVHAGCITLATPARTVHAGLPFAHIVEPLPPNLLAQMNAGSRVRLVEVGFRLLSTAALAVDLGRGLIDLPLHRFGPQPNDGAPPVPVTGDRRLRRLGWVRDIDKPLWRIEQDTPLPFTLLSVVMELKVND